MLAGLPQQKNEPAVEPQRTCLVVLNDLAASSLRDGNDHEALRIFQDALTSLRTGSAEDYAREPHHASSARRSDRSAPLQDLKPLLYSIPAVTDAANHDLLLKIDSKRSPSNAFSMFDRVFVFHDRQKHLRGEKYALPQVPAVIMYNIGLVHHRKAIIEGCQISFERAKELYLMSLRLLEENVTWGVYSSQFNLLLLALFNNLGHIHSHFYNIPETARCREQMLITFLWTDCTRLLTKEEYIFFYMNLLLTAEAWPSLAPAA